MAEIDVPTIMRHMAAYIRTLPEFRSAYDAPPNTLDRADLPAVVLYWDAEEDTTIQPDMNSFMWLPVIRARIHAVAREGDTPQEFAAGNALVTPLVNAFQRGNPTDLMPGLSGSVSRLQATRVRASLLLGYAGTDYYGAEVIFTGKFHRRPVQ